MAHSFSVRDRFQIAEAALKLKNPVLSAIPKVLEEIGSPEQVWTLDGVAANLQQHVRDEYGYTVFTRPFIDKGSKTLEGHWQRFKGEVPLDAYGVGKFSDFARDFTTTMETYRARYPELVNDEVITGAGFGFLASRIIMDSLGTRAISPKALTAISLLHPITDNALDRGLNLGSSMKKISLELKGERQTPESEYERTVFELIHDIQSEYPPDQHPALHEYLRGLHASQLESAVVQRNGKTSDDALIELAARKGGFTALALAYISKGKLSPEQEKFFFNSGILFQLGDDLLDVKEDARDGTQTIWTRAKKNPAAMKAALAKFLAIQDHLEKANELANADPQADALRKDLQLGIKFYLLSAYLNGDAGPHFDRLVKEKFPLSPENARSVAFSIYRAIQQQRDKMSPDLQNAFEVYRRIFDRHFLQDQFAKFDAEKPGSPAKSWKVSNHNPLFLLVRAAHAIEEHLRGGDPVGSVKNDPNSSLQFSGALIYMGLASIAKDPRLSIPLLAATVPLIAWKKTRAIFTLVAPVAATLYLYNQLNASDIKNFIPIATVPFVLTATKDNSPAMLAAISILVS